MAGRLNDVPSIWGDSTTNDRWKEVHADAKEATMPASTRFPNALGVIAFNGGVSAFGIRHQVAPDHLVTSQKQFCHLLQAAATPLVDTAEMKTTRSTNNGKSS